MRYRRQHQSPSTVTVSRPACTHSSQVKARLLQPLCLSQQARGLTKPDCVDLLSFTHPPQRLRSHPDAFFFFSCPTYLHGGLSCSFGCIGDLLPISHWFSVSIVPHVDVFSMCLLGEMSFKSSYSAIVIPPQEVLLNLLNKHIAGYCVRLIYFSYLCIMEMLFFIIRTVVFLHFLKIVLFIQSSLIGLPLCGWHIVRCWTFRVARQCPLFRDEYCDKHITVCFRNRILC